MGNMKEKMTFNNIRGKTHKAYSINQTIYALSNCDNKGVNDTAPILRLRCAGSKFQQHWCVPLGVKCFLPVTGGHSTMSACCQYLVWSKCRQWSHGEMQGHASTWASSHGHRLWHSRWHMEDLCILQKHQSLSSVHAASQCQWRCKLRIDWNWLQVANHEWFDGMQCKLLRRQQHPRHQVSNPCLSPCDLGNLFCFCASIRQIHICLSVFHDTTGKIFAETVVFRLPFMFVHKCSIFIPRITNILTREISMKVAWRFARFHPVADIALPSLLLFVALSAFADAVKLYASWQGGDSLPPPKP